MADGGPHGERMKLQQTLHGYSDGHRRLVGSVTLKRRDAKSMLMLSDVSGPDGGIDEAGYLTGYPLSASGVYALARTWAAPEMPRPGCAWTHSILIDFADLAVLPSLNCVVSLFRRPQGTCLDHYGAPLTFVNGSDPVILTLKDQAWSRSVLAGLYGEPGRSVIAGRPSDVDVERVMLTVWSQQWPRLRRSFRFCTFATADRSNEEFSFDLQLLPSMDRSVRLRFTDSINADSADIYADSWIVEASADLVQPDVSGLRSFLRRTGGDGAMGRKAFRPLCQLHELVKDFGNRREAIDEAITLVDDELSSLKARAAERIVASAALSHADEIRDGTLDFLLRHLDLLGSEDLTNAGARLGRAVWNRDPEEMFPLLEGDAKFRVIPQHTFESLSLGDLVKGLLRVPSLAHAALTYRTKLVTEPKFWSRNLEMEDSAFAVMARFQGVRNGALTAMITAQREDLAAIAVDQFGSWTVLDVVGSVLKCKAESRDLKQWLLAASEPKVISQYLATGSKRPRALLVALARLLPPDVVPNIVGVDPWLTAIGDATGVVSDEDTLYLSAYLLRRALGFRSRSAAELAQQGFEPVHIAAASNRLSDEAWQLLERVLPTSIFSFDWDRCERIRAGVIELFVDRNLEPRIFARIVADDKLFIDLARALVHNWSGRRYLKRVSRAMKNESRTEFRVRIQRVDKLLR